MPVSTTKTVKEQRKGRGSHPNSRANLKPIPPGVSLNPDGKAPGTKDRSTVFKRWLALQQTITDPETAVNEVGTVEDALALALIQKGRTGDVQACREVFDSTYGKISDKTELTGKDGGAIAVVDVEQAIAGFMADAAKAGEPCQREDAIRYLAPFIPGIK